MIVLSAGMQKSGTGWYFNLTNDLLVAAGYQDVRAVRKRFHLHPIIQERNCRITPTLPKLALIAIPHLLGSTFVVKTHQPPSEGVRLFLSCRIMKATYIYRDPRDVVVSAYDHGQRIRKDGVENPLGQLDSMEAAIFYVKGLLNTWEAWLECSRKIQERVLLVRYEDLVAAPLNELSRLAHFLQIGVPARTVRQIVETYTTDRIKANERGLLHYNKGKAGRFRQVLTNEQLKLCQEHFDPYLKEMGYPV